jgi:hypothetical protein
VGALEAWRQPPPPGTSTRVVCIPDFMSGLWGGILVVKIGLLPRRGCQTERWEIKRGSGAGGAPCGVDDTDDAGIYKLAGPPVGWTQRRGPQVALSARVDLRGLLVGHGRPVAEEPVAGALTAVGVATLGRAEPSDYIALGIGGLRPHAEFLALRRLTVHAEDGAPRHGHREEQRAVPALNVEKRGFLTFLSTLENRRPAAQHTDP